MQNIHYSFSAKVWRHSSSGGWFFVSVPIEISREIRQNLKWQEEGWGRLKAKAQIGQIQWNTSIWFDKKQNSYLLPIKSEIRIQENVLVEQIIEIGIWV